MMNNLLFLIESPFMQGIGWAIIHSLWQGLLIGLGLRLTLVFTKSPSFRYAISYVSLALFFLLFLYTFQDQYQQWRPQGIITPEEKADLSSSLPPKENPNQTPSPENIKSTATKDVEIDNPVEAQPISFHQLLLSLIPYVSVLWILGLFFFILRLLYAWIYLLRLSKNSQNIPLGKNWYKKAVALQQKLDIARNIQFCTSPFVSEPITFHHFKPIVLFPIGMLNTLSTDEVEAALLHELSHIKRNDYLFNLLQTVLEAFLFYHPMTWWISRQIHQSREECCDELSVTVSNDRFTYANCLLLIQKYSLNYQNPLSMATSGKNRSLTNRIHRILQFQPNKPGKRSTPIGFLLVFLLMLFSFYAFSDLGNREDRVISVSADKMNVLYIGVDNPLTIAVEGIKSENVKVYSLEDNLTIKEQTPGYYSAKATTPGIGKIRVEGEDFQARTIKFRIKRIPDPIATIEGNFMQKTIPVDEFKEFKKIDVRMNCFPMEVVGKIISFEAVRVPKKGDPIVAFQEQSGAFNKTIRKMIKDAKPGDTYYFDKITGQVGFPDENNPPRKLNALVFKIQ